MQALHCKRTTPNKSRQALHSTAGTLSSFTVCVTWRPNHVKLFSLLSCSGCPTQHQPTTCFSFSACFCRIFFSQAIRCLTRPAWRFLKHKQGTETQPAAQNCRFISKQTLSTQPHRHTCAQPDCTTWTSRSAWRATFRRECTTHENEGHLACHRQATSKGGRQAAQLGLWHGNASLTCAPPAQHRHWRGMQWQPQAQTARGGCETGGSSTAVWGAGAKGPATCVRGA